jgi:hypothetical protein
VGDKRSASAGVVDEVWQFRGVASEARSRPSLPSGRRAGGRRRGGRMRWRPFAPGVQAKQGGMIVGAGDIRVDESGMGPLGGVKWRALCWKEELDGSCVADPCELCGWLSRSMMMRFFRSQIKAWSSLLWSSLNSLRKMRCSIASRF